MEPEISPELRDYLHQTNQRWKWYARAVIPLPQRSILALMTFFGVVLAYAMRICLSMTIISIVEPIKETNKLPGVCPFPTGYNQSVHLDTEKKYDWDESLIGYILSSFYIGYVLTHIPGGILSDLLGGKHVLTGCVILTSFFTLITPLCITDGGPYILILIRVLMGLVQGTLFPTVNVLLAAWIPREERTFYGAVVYGSSQIGTVVGTVVSGELMNKYKTWKIVFYVFGAIGSMWCLLFNIMCSSDPQSHPYISDEEKEMLNTKIGVIHRTSRIQDAPWSEMLTNVPLLALICAQIGHDFGFFIMVTDLPKYLSDVLHFDIRANGYLSALPFIVMFIASLITGFIADFIIDHSWISLVNCRKIFTALGAVLPAFGLIAASYARCNRDLVVVFFTISMGTMGFYYSGMRVNGLDLSPRFAGTVMAFVNGVGAAMGVIAPILVGIVTPKHTIDEYRIVFWVAFILLNGTLVVYIFWASGDIQPFNAHGHRSKPLPHVPDM